MLWLKAAHVFGVIAWFAGLFYLPRLFVYHADASDEIGIERFIVMERRLYVMMSIGATIAIVFGISMLLMAPGYLSQGWLKVKLLLVLILIIEAVTKRLRTAAPWTMLGLLLAGVVAFALKLGARDL